MSVQYDNFYAQRVLKERLAKDHFDKVAHIHRQIKMKDTIASGFSLSTDLSSNDIIRNRVLSANQENSLANNKKPGRVPLYFVNTSNALRTSDPNTIRDMGGVRNCEYRFNDVTSNTARNVTWRELIDHDEQITGMLLNKTSSQKQFDMKSTVSLIDRNKSLNMKIKDRYCRDKTNRRQ